MIFPWSKKCGVYKVTNLFNNRVYYGSSKNLVRRFGQHKSDLNRNRHANKSMQEDYAFFGSDCFEYSVVIYCSINDLKFYEQRVLNEFFDGGDLCYNQAKDACSPTKGLKFTKEHKNKIANKLMGNTNGLGNKAGKGLTPHNKTPTDIENSILSLLNINIPVKTIAKQFGIHFCSVYNIKNRHRGLNEFSVV